MKKDKKYAYVSLNKIIFLLEDVSELSKDIYVYEPMTVNQFFS